MQQLKVGSKKGKWGKGNNNNFLKIQHINIVDLETKWKANPEKPKLSKQSANHKKIKISYGSFFPIPIQFSAFQCY